MFRIIQGSISCLCKAVNCKPLQKGKKIPVFYSFGRVLEGLGPLYTSPSEIWIPQRQNFIRILSGQPDSDKKSREPATSEDEDDDWSNDDTSFESHKIFKDSGGNDGDANHADVFKGGGGRNNQDAFHAGTSKESGGKDQDASHADASDDDYMKPQPRKERIRKCLAKLRRGPDGRFINVLEVTSDINMLIAAYQSLKAKSRPTYLIEDSDDDDSMEGINIVRLKKLQKRLRNGTYRVGTQKEPKKK